MGRIVLLLTVLLLPAFYLHAQSTEDSVKAAVNLLFEGMNNSDGVLVQKAFADSAILQTIAVNKGGKTTIKNVPVQSFAETVSKQDKGECD